MEKTLCDDCSEEAKIKIEARQFCKDCAMRILQSDTSRLKSWLGSKRQWDNPVSWWFK